jgi:hypothetical protein
MPVRVRNVVELAEGSMKVSVLGREADAEYVAQCLQAVKDVDVVPPKPEPGGEGILFHVLAKGSEAYPPSREVVIKLFKGDPEIILICAD